MIKSIKTIEGMAGCGKTHKIKELCSKINDGKCLYITFNRRIMEETKKQIVNHNVIIHTIHSLIYNELKLINMLPDELLNFDADESAKSNGFKKLESIFLDHFKMDFNLKITEGIHTIFVDEYQNVSTVLIKIVKLLCDKLDVDLYLVGDRHQSINSYLNKNIERDNFSQIKNDFGKEVQERIILNKNYRSSNSILNLINSYTKNNLNIEQEYLYKAEPSNDRQTMNYFTSHVEEVNFIKLKARKIHDEGNKSIAILSKWKRNLATIKNWIDKEKIDWLEASTIHAYNGKEADVVFLIGYEMPDTDEEKRVIYTAISRAKLDLFITSSFPFYDPTITFSKNIEVTNLQKIISKPYYQLLPVIKINKNLTLKKFIICSIDSISLKVLSNRVPFKKYVKNQVGLGRKFENSYIDNNGGIPIKVNYSNSHGVYSFDLQDVNMLRSNGYTNRQVIIYLTDYILKYFNYQISREDIILHSLDICRIVSFHDQLYQHIRGNGITCKNKPVKVYANDTGTIVWNVIDSFNDCDLDKASIYYNFHNKRNKSLTLVVYKPIDKNNEITSTHNKNNRFHNKDAVKVEIRYKYLSLDKGYSFGIKEITSIYLIDQLKVNATYIDSIFDNTIRCRSKK